MLLASAKPTDLWGKKVCDANGRFLGEVIAVGSRRGVVRKIVVQSTRHAERLRLVPSTGAQLQGETLVFPLPPPTTGSRVRSVR